MTSLMPAVMYGNERTKPATITTDPGFGTGVFRNVHLFGTCSQFLWRCLFPTSLCCALPINEQNCEFPTGRDLSLLAEQRLLALYKHNYGSYCGTGDFSQLTESAWSCWVLREGHLAGLILSCQLPVSPIDVSAAGSVQVPVILQVSLQRCQGWVHIKPHGHCVCLMLLCADPSQGLDLWLGLEPAKLRIQDLAWICLCIYTMTEKANSLQANMSQNKNTVKVSWAQQRDDIPATRSTLKLPDQPEGLLGKSPEKMPAGKPPTDTQLASQNNWSLNVWHSAPGTAVGHGPATEQYQGLLIKFSNRNIAHGKHCYKS